MCPRLQARNLFCKTAPFRIIMPKWHEAFNCICTKHWELAFITDFILSPTQFYPFLQPKGFSSYEHMPDGGRISPHYDLRVIHLITLFLPQPWLILPHRHFPFNYALFSVLLWILTHRVSYSMKVTVAGLSDFYVYVCDPLFVCLKLRIAAHYYMCGMVLQNDIKAKMCLDATNCA